MRRVRYYEYGAPEVLTVEEADTPEPGPGQVRLHAEAIGANYVDTKIRANAGSIFFRPLPGSPTGDVVGTVDAVGPGVDRTWLGRRVASLVDPDAYADFALADAAWLAPVPEGVSPEAASLPSMAAPVALGLLRTGRLTKGETVLIHSAAGNIGALLVQLARRAGAGTVLATASAPTKREHARSLGADTAFDYTAPDWADQIRAVAPAGVDLILDAAGGAVLADSLPVMAPLGRTVVYGAASGDLISIPVRSLFGMGSVAGFSLLAWRAARPEEARADLTESAHLFAEGRLKADLRAALPLTEAAEAHRLLEDRATFGRVLLLP